MSHKLNEKLKKLLENYTQLKISVENNNITKIYDETQQFFILLKNFYSNKIIFDVFILNSQESNVNNQTYCKFLSKVMNKLCWNSTICHKIVNKHSLLLKTILADDYEQYMLNCKKYNLFSFNNVVDEKTKILHKKILNDDEKITNSINSIYETQILTYISDLNGISEHIIEEIIKNNNKYGNDNKFDVKLTKKLYNECMSFVKNSVVRKKIMIVMNSLIKSISSDVVNIIINRTNYANSLNFSNYSELLKYVNNYDYENIYTNIITISTQLNNKYFDEYASICKKNELDYWDIFYNLNSLKMNINITETDIREYFPLQHVSLYIIKLYQLIFDVDVEICGLKNENGLSFDCYKIKTKNGKMHHNLHINFNSKNLLNGEIKMLTDYNCNHYILASFNNRMYRNQILLNTCDVICLLKEFGCVFTNILFHTKYGVTTHTEISQILINLFEFLFWNKNVIKFISSHYITKNKLPDTIIHKLAKIKNVDLAFNYKNMCFVALYDYFLFQNNNFHLLCIKIQNKDCTHTLLQDLYVKLFDKIYNIDGITINNNISQIPMNIFSNNNKNFGKQYVLLFDLITSFKIFQKECNGNINKKIGQLFLNLHNVKKNYDLSLTDEHINFFNIEYGEMVTKEEVKMPTLINNNDDAFSVIESLTQMSDVSEYTSDNDRSLNHFGV